MMIMIITDAWQRAVILRSNFEFKYKVRGTMYTPHRMILKRNIGTSTMNVERDSGMSLN